MYWKVWLCLIKYFLSGCCEFMVVEEGVNSEAFLNFGSKSMSWLLHKAFLFARNGISLGSRKSEVFWIEGFLRAEINQVSLAYLHWSSCDIEDREVMSLFTLCIELGKTSNSSLQVFRLIWRIISWAVGTHWPNISAWNFLFKHNSVIREGITIKACWQCRSLGMHLSPNPAHLSSTPLE